MKKIFNLCMVIVIIMSIFSVALIKPEKTEAATITTEYLKPITSWSLLTNPPLTGSRTGHKFTTSPTTQNGSFNWLNVLTTVGVSGSNSAGSAGFFRDDLRPVGQPNSGGMGVNAHQIDQTTSPNATVTASWIDLTDIDGLRNNFIFRVRDKNNTIITKMDGMKRRKDTVFCIKFIENHQVKKYQLFTLTKI